MFFLLRTLQHILNHNFKLQKKGPGHTGGGWDTSNRWEKGRSVHVATLLNRVQYIVALFGYFERNNTNHLIHLNNDSEKGLFYCIQTV